MLIVVLERDIYGVSDHFHISIFMFVDELLSINDSVLAVARRGFIGVLYNILRG